MQDKKTTPHHVFSISSSRLTMPVVIILVGAIVGLLLVASAVVGGSLFSLLLRLLQPLRKLQIINDSGSRIQVIWIHPRTNQPIVIMRNVSHGVAFPITSPVNDELEIHELPNHNNNNMCAEMTCRRAMIQVSKEEHQVLTIDKQFQVILGDTMYQPQQDEIKKKQTNNDNIIQNCQEKFLGILLPNSNATTNHNYDSFDSRLQQFTKCVQDNVATLLEEHQDELVHLKSIRQDMAMAMEDFSCHDDVLETTRPFAIERWKSSTDNITRRVRWIHQRPSSEIHIIEHFISPVECAAVEAVAANGGGLDREALDDWKGRLRDKASYTFVAAKRLVQVPFEEPTNPITQVSKRIFAYANHVLHPLNLTKYGQERLISLQYHGGRNNTNDTTEPVDQYRPHCDEDCNGLPHTKGSRVATLAMYCTLPEKGGYLNFGNAHVHIKPQPGMGVFFSYIDPHTKYMDDGWSSHSGCPVYEGVKKMVSMRIRYGVDQYHPWYSFYDES